MYFNVGNDALLQRMFGTSTRPVMVDGRFDGKSCARLAIDTNELKKGDLCLHSASQHFACDRCLLIVLCVTTAPRWLIPLIQVAPDLVV